MLRIPPMTIFVSIFSFKTIFAAIIAIKGTEKMKTLEFTGPNL